MCISFGSQILLGTLVICVPTDLSLIHELFIFLNALCAILYI